LRADRWLFFVNPRVVLSGSWTAPSRPQWVSAQMGVSGHDGLIDHEARDRALGETVLYAAGRTLKADVERPRMALSR